MEVFSIEKWDLIEQDKQNEFLRQAVFISEEIILLE